MKRTQKSKKIKVRAAWMMKTSSLGVMILGVCSVSDLRIQEPPSQ